ncbi:PAS domain S-box protein [uncultured Nostoc sp.]|uniref:PAS domain S-box protein n=1 Tax=uncultured Nostoc sp. TaxID=340711 RepID=UPI0035CA0B3F
MVAEKSQDAINQMDETIKNEQATDVFIDSSKKSKQAELEDTIISHQISNCIPTLREISGEALNIANQSLAIAFEEQAAEFKKVLNQLNNEIAKRQEAETHLCQKTLENQAILQLNSDLYFRIDADANILDYQIQNPQTINKLTEVVIGKNFLEYLPDNISNRYQKAIIQVQKSKSSVKVEYFVLEENSNFEAKIIPLLEQQIGIIVSQKKQLQIANNSINFQRIVENTNNIIFALTLEGIFSYVSPNWTEILGHEIAELEGNSFAPFVHPDDLPMCVDYFQRVLTTGEKQDAIEYRVKHKNGTWQWHTSNSSAIKDANGNFLYFVGICHDTSDRKHAQEALAERSRLANFRADVDAALAQSQTLESMMRRCTEALVEHINAAFARIWILNKQENVLELQASSGMYTHIDGPHRRVPVGQFKIGLIAQESKPHLTNSVLTDPRVSNQEWAKREGMVAFAGYPLILEGETVGVIAMFSRQMMTESVFNALEFAAQEIAIGIKRKQAEVALRESEARFRHLVETTNDGVWELDQNGVYTYVSQKIADILGYEAEEVLGKTLFDLMPPAEANRVQKIFQVLSNSKKPLINFENKTLHKNGQLLVLETNGVPFFDESGNYLGYRGVYQDITERKQAEEALQALVAGTAAVTGEEFFPVLVRHLANALGVCYVILAERITGDSGRARVLSFWAGDKLSETFVEYALANTPCEVVLQEGMRSYPCNIQQLFPQAKDLVILEAESYLGTPLVDTFGIPIGHLCVLDTKPILQEERAKAILSIFAARATAELQRQCTETALRKSEAKYRAIAQREALLNHLASQIRASLELNYILKTAVQEIRNLFQIDYCAFFWYRQNADLPYWECVYEAEYFTFPHVLTAQAIHIEFEIIAAKTLNREIIRIDDVKTYDERTIQQFLNDFGFTAFMSLPVHTQSGEIGAFICGYCSGFRPWQETEVELLQAVTVQLAIAIDQAKLYTHSRLAAQTAQEKAQQLEAALLELQQTQAQLIQTEKMSSLGHLVAGIAHEINNPINFIYGNIKHTNEYVTDLLHLVEIFQEHHSPLSPEIQTQIQNIDLNFLYQDLPKVLHSMKAGAERIQQIVLSLRNFSRLDENGTKAVDIHEGINSTLLLLRSRLKAKAERPEIQIIQEYGNLPQVLCNAGQMNQVFMNLLTNAIDALEEGLGTKDWELGKEPSKSSILKICIRTLVQENECIIRIADNGCGMTDEVRNHIFDPFFTTKPVGKGTGMGLSICYQIVVKNHRGQFQCISAPGAGAEFIITIPIQ